MGQVLFIGEIITYTSAKIGWGHLKIFLRITGPEKLRFT
jgi:hypothetical protein